MYTEQEYLYGWLFYALGALLLIGSFWWLTSVIRFRPVRLVLRVVFSVAMFTPWYASDDLEYLAPAWLIAAYEGVFEGGDAFWRAGAPLVSAAGVALGVCLLVLLARYFARRPSRQDAPAEAANP